MTTAQIFASPANAPAAAPERLATAAFAYAAYAATVTVLCWPSVAIMVKTWFSSSAYHHGALIAPAAVLMAMRAGRADGAPRPAPAALIAVTIAAFVWLCGRAAGVNLAEQFGFVTLLITGAAAIFGFSQLRRWAFPALFLYFMVPFGTILLPLLQSLTAELVVSLLKLSGFAASLNGAVITVSGRTYEVAEACAGLNFLLAAVIIAAIYSWAAFVTRWKIALFVTFAAILAIGANILRAFLVIWAATITAGKYAIAADHIILGLAFYGVLLFVLVVVGRRFSEAAAGITRIRTASAGAATTTSIGAAAIAAAAIASAAAVYAHTVVDRKPVLALPAALPFIAAPGWQAAGPFPGWRASLDHADRRLEASYQSRGRVLQLSLGYFAYDRPGSEIVGYATRASDGDTWRSLGSRTIDADAFGERRKVTIETLESRWGDRLAVARLYWLGDAVFAEERALKLEQARLRLSGRRPRGGVIFAAAAATKNGSGEDALRDFLRDAEPLSFWLARIDARLSRE